MTTWVVTASLLSACATPHVPLWWSLRSTWDQTADAVVVVDRKSRIVAWNLSMETLTGISRDKVIGSFLIQDFLPPSEKGGALSTLTLTLQHGDNLELEFPILTADGRSVRYHATTEPVRNRRGEVIAAMLRGQLLPVRTAHCSGQTPRSDPARREAPLFERNWHQVKLGMHRSTVERLLGIAQDLTTRERQSRRGVDEYLMNVNLFGFWSERWSFHSYLDDGAEDRHYVVYFNQEGSVMDCRQPTGPLWTSN